MTTTDRIISALLAVIVTALLILAVVHRPVSVTLCFALVATAMVAANWWNN